MSYHAALNRSPIRRRALLALGASLVLTAALGGEASAALPPPRPAPGSPGAKTQHEDFIWPTHGVITTRFGEVGPYSPRGHQGIDIAAPTGTPVLAATGGRVALAGATNDGYGIQVLIDHPDGTRTRYGHLSQLLVGSGESVAQGQLVGRVGSTGYSTGPHLHFEVMQDGGLRDPLRFLS